MFLIAAIGLLPPLAAAVLLGCAGDTGTRLVALQFANGVAALIIVFFSVAFSQPSLVDLALTLVFLGFPGTLVFAHFLERWL
jgi:multisubunit Na+/H+ antiporter MnhF subunit